MVSIYSMLSIVRPLCNSYLVFTILRVLRKLFYSIYTFFLQLLSVNIFDLLGLPNVGDYIVFSCFVSLFCEPFF